MSGIFRHLARRLFGPFEPVVAEWSQTLFGPARAPVTAEASAIAEALEAALAELPQAVRTSHATDTYVYRMPSISARIEVVDDLAAEELTAVAQQVHRLALDHRLAGHRTGVRLQTSIGGRPAGWRLSPSTPAAWIPVSVEAVATELSRGATAARANGRTLNVESEWAEPDRAMLTAALPGLHRAIRSSAGTDLEQIRRGNRITCSVVPDAPTTVFDLPAVVAPAVAAITSGFFENTPEQLRWSLLLRIDADRATLIDPVAGFARELRALDLRRPQRVDLNLWWVSLEIGHRVEIDHWRSDRDRIANEAIIRELVARANGG